MPDQNDACANISAFRFFENSAQRAEGARFGLLAKVAGDTGASAILKFKLFLDVGSRGEVAEWLMAPVLKTGIPEKVSGVRIPPSPPVLSSRWSRVDFLL
jgi:hypothetical protein